VVTEDIKAGQLLVVNNPLAIARVDANDFGFQIDLQAGCMVTILVFAWMNNMSSV